MSRRNRSNDMLSIKFPQARMNDDDDDDGNRACYFVTEALNDWLPRVSVPCRAGTHLEQFATFRFVASITVKL